VGGGHEVVVAMWSFVRLCNCGQRVWDLRPQIEWLGLGFDCAIRNSVRGDEGR
jgi:hypothetical protein